MRIDIVSLFPELVTAFFAHSIIGRAAASGIMTFGVTNPRDFSTNKHHHVDDTPYGGGSGMLMQAEPIYAAVEHLLPERTTRTRIILTAPTGTPFTQETAKRLATYDHLVLICGHYEGIDQRVEDGLADETVSVGDYVLTGGELPAMVITDAVVRMIPGVLGATDSAGDDSFYTGLLEYPQYTKPAVFRGQAVPEVLLSGHHANIAAWRRRESLRRTWERRPELLAAASLTDEERRLIAAWEDGNT